MGRKPSPGRVWVTLTEAARMLGVSRQTVRRRFLDWGIRGGWKGPLGAEVCTLSLRDIERFAASHGAEWAKEQSRKGGWPRGE